MGVIKTFLRGCLCLCEVKERKEEITALQYMSDLQSKSLQQYGGITKKLLLGVSLHRAMCVYGNRSTVLDHPHNQSLPENRCMLINT